MKKLCIPNVYTWSHYSQVKKQDFNSYLVVRAEGNIAIDPMPLIDVDKDEIATLGGVRYVLVNNKQHERDARAVAEHFGAELWTEQSEVVVEGLDREYKTFAGGTSILSDIETIPLPSGKTKGECAYFFPRLQALYVGDLIMGDPQGDASFLPDPKLRNPAAAKREAVRLLDLDFKHLLVGDGHSVFYRGKDAVRELLVRERVM